MKRPPARRLALAAAGLLAGAALIALAELAARALTAPPEVPTAEELEFLRESARPFFALERRDGREILRQQPAVWLKVRGQRFPAAKPAGGRRILVVGESTADLLAEVLRERVEAAGSKSRVIDCAVGGGSVEYVERRYDECKALGPDAVVVAFGHNAVVRHPSFPGLAAWSGELARASRLAALALAAHEDEPKPAERLAALDAFLRRVEADCSAKGLPLIVVAPPANLLAAPVSDPADRADPLYLEALFEADTGRRSEASERLELAVRRRPAALWFYQAGLWRLAAGQAAQARELLTTAVEADRGMHRDSQRVRSVLLESARRSGAAFVDGDAVLSSLAPGGVAGWESFRDPQHARRPGIVALARLCLQEFETKGWTALPRERPARAAARELLSVDLRTALWMAVPRDPAWRLSLGAFSAWRLDEMASQGPGLLHRLLVDPSDRGAVELSIAEALWTAGRREEARRHIGSARALWRASAEPDFLEGRLWLRDGRKDRAKALLESAAALEPFRPEPRYYLERLAGRPAPPA